MRHVFHAAKVLAAAVWLSGCVATAPVVESNGAYAPVISKEGEGDLLVRVVNVQKINEFNPKWEKLVVKETSTGQLIHIDDTAPAVAGYSLFAGSIPQGQYEFVGFRNEGSQSAVGGFFVSALLQEMSKAGANVQTSPSTFAVKPGAVTNLGTIVSALPETPGGGMKLAILADQANRESALADLAPSTRARLSSKTALGWNSEPDPRIASQDLSAIRPYVRSPSPLEVTSDGRLMIGSPLGLVHIRSTSGQWSTMSTGSLDTITVVRALKGGNLVAGADTGRYFVWSARDTTWNAYRAADGDRIVQIEPMGDLGYAILVESRTRNVPKKTSIRVLFKERLDASTEAKELMQSEVRSTMNGTMFFDGQELFAYLNLSGMVRTSNVLRFNPRTGEQSSQTENFWAKSFYRLSDGTVARERFNGTSFYTDFSNDGKTWQKDGRLTPSAARFLDRQSAYGITLRSMGWSTSTFVLSKTTNGGSSWENVGSNFELSKIDAVRVVGQRMYVHTGKELLSSQDEGKTWNVEWPASAASP